MTGCRRCGGAHDRAESPCYEPPRIQAADEAPTPSWRRTSDAVEYRFIRSLFGFAVPEHIEEQFARLGADGWELCAVIGETLIFKRAATRVAR